MGENIQIVGSRRLEAGSGEYFDTYVHTPQNRIGAVVLARGGSRELAHQLALHIASARPTFKTRDEVSPELVEAERDVLMNSDEVQSKPEAVREKIVEGMLNKRFFGANVLAEQEWIHDGSLKVDKVLADARAEVLEFQRFSLAG
jgi:elongation factor Ts